MSKNSPVIEIYRVITQFRGLATQTPITHATTYPANYDSIILPKTKTLSGSTLGSIRNLSNSNLQQTALVAVYSLGQFIVALHTYRVKFTDHHPFYRDPPLPSSSQLFALE